MAVNNSCSSRISLFKPNYNEREAEAVCEVLRSGWIGLGPKTAEFERRFAKRVGAKYAIALNSCTMALEIALRLLDIGPGDDVIVPAMTFVATGHAVVSCGATPVFCDVRPDTLTIDWDDAFRRVTKRTKAIMPVLYAGQVIECPDTNIPLVYDCAHASGSGIEANGKLCCWSFHAVKNLACGDGGMLTTDDEAFSNRARRLCWHGIDKGTWDRSGPQRYTWEYECSEVGYKAHMNDITAALGLVQLDKLSQMQQRRLSIAAQYYEQIGAVVETPLTPPGHGCHLYVIRTERRNELADYLAERGITTGVHYKPIHLYPCYDDQPRLPVAEREWQRILSLPMHTGLTDVEVEVICDEIKRFFQ